MGDTKTTEAAIYCGTYAKYNDGNLKGKWFKLSDYADADALLDACREFHKDEPDPELMFQDFEGFPRSYYSESPDKALLDKAYEWEAASESDREIWDAYIKNMGKDAELSDALDAYAGTYRSVTAWAENFIEETGMLADVSETISRYFDYEAFGLDAEKGGDIWTTEGGDGILVFNNT